MKKILLLGSGELGKEFTISAKKYGCTVIACDSYVGAPAMKVADDFQVLDMLDANELEKVISYYKPDLIVPEIEAINTEFLVEKEQQGYKVVPSARAVNLTMNRDKIRDRAVELGLKTANFRYAENLDQLESAARQIGFPCVVKPVMSSSGKGQMVVDDQNEIQAAWKYAIDNMRGDRHRVIVEEFIDFSYEITLLTVRQKDGPTLFCPIIEHEQERGDYQRSWQSKQVETFTSHIIETHAQEMAKIITDDLGGEGIFGVEFFIDTSTDNPTVIFSEISPRPHDTGLVTLYTQNLSEFDLHARAILGLPIDEIKILREGASQVILADCTSPDFIITGIPAAMKITGVDVRIFGKPVARPNRRMGVVLAPTVGKAKKAASKIVIFDISASDAP